MDDFRKMVGDVAQENLPEGSLLVGWVAVMEWVTPDGSRHLVLIDGSDTESIPEWQRDGYLVAALKSGWRGPEDEE